MFEAWCAWRGDKLLPTRADMALDDIASILPQIMLFDAFSADRVVIRLAGDMIVQGLGFDPAGVNYVELAQQHRREARRSRMAHLIGYPCAASAVYRHYLQSGVGVPMEVITLPIEQPDSEARLQLITAMEPLGELPATVAPTGEDFQFSSEFFEYIDIGAGKPGSVPFA